MIKRVTRLFFLTAFFTASVFTLWAGAQDEGTAAEEIPKIELMFQGWVNQPTDDSEYGVVDMRPWIYAFIGPRG